MGINRQRETYLILCHEDGGIAFSEESNYFLHPTRSCPMNRKPEGFLRVRRSERERGKDSEKENESKS